LKDSRYPQAGPKPRALPSVLGLVTIPMLRLAAGCFILTCPNYNWNEPENSTGPLHSQQALQSLSDLIFDRTKSYASRSAGEAAPRRGSGCWLTPTDSIFLATILRTLRQRGSEVCTFSRRCFVHLMSHNMRTTRKSWWRMALGIYQVPNIRVGPTAFNANRQTR